LILKRGLSGDVSGFDFSHNLGFPGMIVATACSAKPVVSFDFFQSYPQTAA
jgi:hypothetical protein